MKVSLLKSVAFFLLLVIQTSVFAVDEDKWDEYIQSAADATGLDFYYIKSVVKQESSFRDEVGDGSVVSTNAAGEEIGAIGAMQIMPDTGADLGYTVEQLSDPETNIMAGAEYLLQLSQQSNIDGDLVLMAAGYNAGPGAVQQYGGVPPYAETVNYIQQVAQNYASYTGNVLDTSGLPEVTPGSGSGSGSAGSDSSSPLISPTIFADISDAIESFEALTNTSVSTIQSFFKGLLVFLMMLLAGVQILFFWKEGVSQDDEEVFVGTFFFSMRALLLMSFLFVFITAL